MDTQTDSLLLFRNSRDGVEEWKTVDTGSDGAVISEMRGTNTRRAAAVPD